MATLNWKPETAADPKHLDRLRGRVEAALLHWRTMLNDTLIASYARKMPSIRLDITSTCPGCSVDLRRDPTTAFVELSEQMLLLRPTQVIQQIIPCAVASIAAAAIHGTGCLYSDPRLKVILEYMGKWPLPIYEPAPPTAD